MIHLGHGGRHPQAQVHQALRVHLLVHSPWTGLGLLQIMRQQQVLPLRPVPIPPRQDRIGWIFYREMGMHPRRRPKVIRSPTLRRPRPFHHLYPIRMLIHKNIHRRRV